METHGFSQKLRDLRESKGLSRPQLAEAAGLSFGALRSYEVDGVEPSFFNVVRLAKALGVPITYFVPVDDEPIPQPVKRPRGRPKKAAQ